MVLLMKIIKPLKLIESESRLFSQKICGTKLIKLDPGYAGLHMVVTESSVSTWKIDSQDFCEVIIRYHPEINGLLAEIAS